MTRRETVIAEIAAIVAARADTLPLKSSEWLPAPPPDPRLLRRVRRLRWEKTAVLVALAAAWAVALTLLGVLPHLIRSLIIGTWWAWVSTTLAVWASARSRRAAPDVADLLDLPATFPQFPVEVQYRVDQRVYGVDQGVISFVDGWMHFQGRRTTWSLSHSDARVRTVAGVRLFTSISQISQYKGLAPMVRDVTYTRGGKPFVVRLTSMDSAEGLGSGLHLKFNRAIQEWRPAPALGPRNAILPPAEPMPGLLASLDRKLVAAGIVTGALLLATQVEIGWPLGAFPWFLAQLLVWGGVYVFLLVRTRLVLVRAFKPR